MLNEFTRVAAVDDVPDGEMLGVVAGGIEICLAHIAGSFYAIGDICTHFYTLLSTGELHVDVCEVECPLHDSRFNLATGEPSHLPADKPADVYEVRVEGNDILVRRQSA